MKNFKTLITSLFLLSFQSHAAVFVVEDVRDLPDDDLMDGVCDAGLSADVPICTLRAAVMQANASQGEADTILLPNNLGVYKLGLFGDEEDDAISGDLDIKDDLTIINGTQAGATIDGKHKDRIFHVHANSSLTLEGINLISGTVDTNNEYTGGAVLVENAEFHADRSTFSSSIAKRGGAIYAADSIIQITDSYLHNNANSASDLGVTARGSALFFMDSQVTISQSTIAHNILPTINSNNTPIASENSAIYGVGDESFLLLENSTVSHNHHGLSANDVQELNIKHSTLAHNQSFGMQFITGNHLYIDRSLFANNDTNCLIGNIQNTTARTRTGSTDASCQLDDDSNIENMSNPLHSALNYWGGVTPSLMLYKESEAIDAVGTCDVSVLLDQRGFDRPKDGNNDQFAFCDMGAIEFDLDIDDDIIFKNNFSALD